SFAIVPSSVVHTGVKSFGCEKSTPHESPSQSWKRIRPCVVSASKSGAVSPILSVTRSPPPAVAIHIEAIVGSGGGCASFPLPEFPVSIRGRSGCVGPGMYRIVRIVPFLLLALTAVALLGACGGKGGGY